MKPVGEESIQDSIKAYGEDLLDLDKQTVVVAGTGSDSQIISSLAGQLELILLQCAEAAQWLFSLIKVHTL